MKTIAIITADPNDADYITNMFEANQEDIDRLTKIASILKTFSHNWNNCKSTYMEESCPEKLYANVLTPEEIAWMQTKIPDCDYEIHSIANIKIVKIAEEENLFCYDAPNKEWKKW